MSKDSTRLALMLGLAALAAIMPWWLNNNFTALGLSGAIVLGAGFPLLMLRATYKKSRNWSGVTALFMIPYAVIGVMEVVATLGSLNSGALICALGVANFILALDAGRRSS